MALLTVISQLKLSSSGVEPVKRKSPCQPLEDGFGVGAGAGAGAPCASAAVITAGFYILGWNIKENLGNLIFSVFLMILGIFFIMIGLLAEVVSRIYFQTHRIRIISVDRIDDRTGDDGGRAA